MANKMPAELLEKFQKDREEKKAPSGKELQEGKETRARALAKARKAKQNSSKKWSLCGSNYSVRIDVKFYWDS